MLPLMKEVNIPVDIGCILIDFSLPLISLLLGCTVALYPINLLTSGEGLEPRASNTCQQDM